MDGLAIPAKTIRADQRQEESKQAFLLQRKANSMNTPTYDVNSVVITTYTEFT